MYYSGICAHVYLDHILEDIFCNNLRTAMGDYNHPNTPSSACCGRLWSSSGKSKKKKYYYYFNSFLAMLSDFNFDQLEVVSSQRYSPRSW